MASRARELTVYFPGQEQTGGPPFCCDALRDFVHLWGTINVLTGFGMVRVRVQNGLAVTHGSGGAN